MPKIKVKRLYVLKFNDSRERIHWEITIKQMRLPFEIQCGGDTIILPYEKGVLYRLYCGGVVGLDDVPIEELEEALEAAGCDIIESINGDFVSVENDDMELVLASGIISDYRMVIEHAYEKLKGLA